MLDHFEVSGIRQKFGEAQDVKVYELDEDKKVINSYNLSLVMPRVSFKCESGKVIETYLNASQMAMIFNQKFQSWTEIVS